MIQRSPESGFTLVEILVAIFAFSLMMGAGSVLLLSTLRSQAIVESRLDQLGKLELVTAHMRADLGASIPRIVSTGRIGAAPRSLFGGEPDRDGVFLGMVRDGWSNLDALEDRSELLSVEYRLVEGTLVRRLYERADPVRRTPRYETALLENVSDISLQFVDAGIPVSVWGLVQTASVPRLPDSVRFRIEFDNGEALTQSFLVGGRT